jgi:hypothetical protein
MKFKRYLSPAISSLTELDAEYPILAGSQIDLRVKVDPLEEHYYEGTEETSDYLIDF